MMTIGADCFVRALVDAHRAGQYPDDGRYYRVACECQARPDGAGDGWVNTSVYTLADAQFHVEHLQARADRDGNLARCVYLVKTVGGLEVYRTNMHSFEDTARA